ncbi:MAG: 5'/3'-nucleotidase SurE [Proteobacteria bacterium]|nr:5'/3'-nucleotidase SurE [Pseudomonadota bacterium]
MTGKHPNILLTNDDSHDSPLFHHTIDALARLGDLTVVVPAEEQSWKGKSMTRYGPLYAEHIDIHGYPAWSVTGTPADCVNLAIYNLLDQRPDIVVSGINIGKNVGLGFMFSSGTVGACFEANIAGIPALALSQELNPEDFQHWDRERGFKADIAAQLKSLSDHLIPLVWKDLVAIGDPEPTTWNVNFPFTQSRAADIVITRLGHTYYEGCFVRRGDQFHHGLSSVQIDPRQDTDEMVIQSGRVSATKLDMRVLGQQI